MLILLIHAFLFQFTVYFNLAHDITLHKVLSICVPDCLCTKPFIVSIICHCDFDPIFSSFTCFLDLFAMWIVFSVFLCLFFQTLSLPSVWDCSSVQIDSMSTVSYKTVVQYHSFRPSSCTRVFDGCADQAWVLYQCEIFFMHQPRTYSSDSNMCAFMLSLLTGRALSWPSAVWNGDMQVHSLFDNSQFTMSLTILCEDWMYLHSYFQ